MAMLDPRIRKIQPSGFLGRRVASSQPIAAYESAKNISATNGA
jgi:hypothetical protein